ncbi:MAG: glycosyltransferase family 2 protein [Candidatus Ranarchaeia archaeon]
MYKGKSVSLIIPAYNEEKGLPITLKDFQTRKEIDEIIVIDNNSKDGTSEVAKRMKAKVFLEKKQGYGWALRKGLKEAKGDLIILTEADATFKAKDIPRLLEETNNFNFVIGTRTNENWIESGANMGLFLTIGNIFIAKILGLIYGCLHLTDVGCTYRVFTRGILNLIINRLKGQGANLSPEMMVEALRVGAKIKEIPVNYGNRIGEAKITVSKSKAFKNGLDMLWIVFSKLISKY